MQESWLRLSRSDTSDVSNLDGWLTTVVSRVCLDTLRPRRSRREEPLGEHLPEPVARREDGIDPEHEALLADSVPPCLSCWRRWIPQSGWPSSCTTRSPCRSTRSDRSSGAPPPRPVNSPAGRAAGWEGTTAITDDGAAGSVAESEPGAAPSADRARRRDIVDAFLTASRGGDFTTLLALLDPEWCFAPTRPP